MRWSSRPFQLVSAVSLEARKISGRASEWFYGIMGYRLPFLVEWFFRRSLHKMQYKFHVPEIAKTPIWRTAKSERKRHFSKVNLRLSQPTLAMGSKETIDHAPPHLCGK
jgi:hypothetical protein